VYNLDVKQVLSNYFCMILLISGSDFGKVLGGRRIRVFGHVEYTTEEQDLKHVFDFIAIIVSRYY